MTLKKQQEYSTQPLPSKLTGRFLVSTLLKFNHKMLIQINFFISPKIPYNILEETQALVLGKGQRNL